MSKHKLWFKARPYGWGWYPSSWEGFVVIGIWAFWILLLFRFVPPEMHPIRWIAGLWGSIPALIVVCWKKGERPSWRWGGKEVPARTALFKGFVIFGGIAAVIGFIVWHISK